MRKAPDKAKELYADLFIDRTPESIRRTLLDGVRACVRNASRLVQDARLLLAEKRPAVPTFLVSTADEELGKAYLLLDMLRLDTGVHDSTLRSLCRAFYNHIVKYAYRHIAAERHSIATWEKARTIWDIAVTQWWPNSGDPEDPEPSMPHALRFNRDAPLYVDYVAYDQAWHCPVPGTGGLNFLKAPWGTMADSTASEIGRWTRAEAAGLLQVPAITVMAEHFSRTYFGSNSSSNDVRTVLESVVSSLSADFPHEQLRASPLMAWPMYDKAVHSRGVT